jgi:hypothetical protein
MLSGHPELFVLKAFIHGECIRIVKRNSCEVLFGQHRELFRYRLLARGYSHKCIGGAFPTVTYMSCIQTSTEKIFDGFDHIKTK